MKPCSSHKSICTSEIPLNLFIALAIDVRSLNSLDNLSLNDLINILSSLSTLISPDKFNNSINNTSFLLFNLFFLKKSLISNFDLKLIRSINMALSSGISSSSLSKLLTNDKSPSSIIIFFVLREK